MTDNTNDPGSATADRADVRNDMDEADTANGEGGQHDDTEHRTGEKQAAVNRDEESPS